MVYIPTTTNVYTYMIFWDLSFKVFILILHTHSNSPTGACTVHAVRVGCSHRAGRRIGCIREALCRGAPILVSPRLGCPQRGQQAVEALQHLTQGGHKP